MRWEGNHRLNIGIWATFLSHLSFFRDSIVVHYIPICFKLPQLTNTWYTLLTFPLSNENISECEQFF